MIRTMKEKQIYDRTITVRLGSRLLAELDQMVAEMVGLDHRHGRSVLVRNLLIRAVVEASERKRARRPTRRQRRRRR